MSDANEANNHQGSTEHSGHTETTRRVLLGAISTGILTPVFAGSVSGDNREDPTITENSVTLIEANEAAGFNFPYYLYTPDNPREKPILVEPVNSGAGSDNFQEDLDAAERTVTRGRARTISEKLRVPLIVPVFANPIEGEFFNRFIQLLDTETMHIEEGKFKRIDLQLIEIIKDAQERLSEIGFIHPKEVMMNGFSASGNFVNNFTALHPSRVASVTAGAINGMATLPFEEANGRTIEYQIGVADLEELIGKPFDRETWADVPQLCYMGETEQPPQDDTIPYRDVWSEEQATKALAVYGEDMQEDRMPYSEALYHRAEATTRFEVYDGVGHSYSDEIVTDIISFHARHNDINHDPRAIADGPPIKDDLEASSCGDVEEHEHDEVNIRFITSPTIGDQYLKVETEVASSFGQRARTRLFPETGGGTWGLGLDRVDAGVSDEKSYEVDPSALRLGEVLELRAFPNDWSHLDDVVASDCAVVTGVRFANIPQAGDGEITLEYMYPKDLSESGRIELHIDGDTIGTLETVEPGMITRDALVT